MKIVWTEPARQDLRDIFTCIAEDNPLLGRTGRIDGTRELVLADKHYILPYRIKEQEIQILAVFHGARQWTECFESIIRKP